MTSLTTQTLRFRYPAQTGFALDGISLTVEAGEVTWLTGALGSGTSTLLLALAGLAPRITGGERSGEVRCLGEDPSDVTPLQHGVAYLGPTPALQLSGIARTVWDEVAVGPMNLCWTLERLRDATDTALARLNVSHLAERRPEQLSGGEQQRVLLAALAATAPRVWLLDEPFAALDHASRLSVAAWIQSLAQDGATVVIASDDADVMAPIADRVVVLDHGVVAVDGNPTTLLAGDAFITAGASTTDAATLAGAAGMPVPRPITTADLLAKTAAIPRSSAPLLAEPPRAHDAPVLSCDLVEFSYRDGAPVLRGVSLMVHAGDAIGLFGANGAGKSTLLRLAMALDHPSGGTLSVLGRATAGLHPEDFAPAVGFLFQQPERQLFASSVRSECGMGPRLAGWHSAAIAEAVESVLDELGLRDAIDEHPYDLPLPRRRLVALAAILVTDPKLLLLDEPTAALDGASRDRVIAAVRARVDRGHAVVAITHDMIFAHEALDLGVRLEGGRASVRTPMRDMLTSGSAPPPASLGVALAHALPAGGDRRADVARFLTPRLIG